MIGDLVVDALAAYRLTRLVTADSILDEPRERLVAWSYRPHGGGKRSPDDPPTFWADAVDTDPDPPMLAALLTCRWCASMWLAAGVVAARRVLPRAWDPMARVLALSALATLGARLEDD